MTCESCGVNAATVHVTEVVGDSMTKRRLCAGCAEKLGVYGGGGPVMVPADELQGRPIGPVLTKMGKLTREQVVEALTIQKRQGGAVGEILVELGYISQGDLEAGLAAQGC
jgi:hypothetical protein